jgi:hypothetical protein
MTYIELFPLAVYPSIATAEFKTLFAYWTFYHKSLRLIARLINGARILASPFLLVVAMYPRDQFEDQDWVWMKKKKKGTREKNKRNRKPVLLGILRSYATLLTRRVPDPALAFPDNLALNSCPRPFQWAQCTLEARTRRDGTALPYSAHASATAGSRTCDKTSNR